MTPLHHGQTNFNTDGFKLGNGDTIIYEQDILGGTPWNEKGK